MPISLPQPALKNKQTYPKNMHKIELFLHVIGIFFVSERSAASSPAPTSASGEGSPEALILPL